MLSSTSLRFWWEQQLISVDLLNSLRAESSSCCWWSQGWFLCMFHWKYLPKWSKLCEEAPSLIGALGLCSRWCAGSFLLVFCQLVIHLWHVWVLMDVGSASTSKSSAVLIQCGCAVTCSVFRVLCSPWALTLWVAAAMDLCRSPGQSLDLSGTDTTQLCYPHLCSSSLKCFQLCWVATQITAVKIAC